MTVLTSAGNSSTTRTCSAIAPGRISLPQQLFRLAERFVAIDRHGSVNLPASCSVSPRRPFRRSSASAHPSYQTATAAGTSGDERTSSRICRPPRDAPPSRSPCGGRIRSAGRRASSVIITRSRVTLARIDAAAIAAQRWSPRTKARCGKSRVRNAEAVHDDTIGQRRQAVNGLRASPRRRPGGR